MEQPAPRRWDAQVGCGADELARAASMLEPELGMP